MPKQRRRHVATVASIRREARRDPVEQDTLQALGIVRRALGDLAAQGHRLGVEVHGEGAGLRQGGDGLIKLLGRAQEAAEDVGVLQGVEDALQEGRQHLVLGVAGEVALEGALGEAGGRGSQVHDRRVIRPGAGQALGAALVADELAGAEVEGEGGELYGAGVDVDAVQVLGQDAVGDLGGGQRGLLLAVHGRVHVERLALEVATAAAGVHECELGQRLGAARRRLVVG